MNARRGFVAFVGELAIGGVTVKGEASATPTLILPPKLVSAATLPTAFPLLRKHQCQMDAILHVGINVPPDSFKTWLEAGLRMANAQGGKA